MQVMDMNTTIGRATIAELKAQKVALINGGQVIHARIRKNSKYYGQSGEGELFPVHILSSYDYPVQGGPGGQYRLDDVDLFVVDEAGARLQIK